jgi:periplasmic divalent cation tolerance protein
MSRGFGNRGLGPDGTGWEHEEKIAAASTGATLAAMPFAPRLVFVMAPSLEEARNIAGAILEKHLAACVNLAPGVESHYWWQGRLEMSGEIMMIIKSSAEHFEALSEVIHARHSYQCPEIVAVAPEEISPSYRSWWESETQRKDA